MRTLTCVVALVGIVASGGCGGGGDSSCMQASACGGEIAPGRYKITSYCTSITGSVKTAFCPAGINIGSSTVSLTGEVTFNADKTYLSQVTLSGTVNETIPAACLTDGQMTLSCVQLTQSLQQDGMGGTCTGSGDCNCSVTLPGMPSMAEGSYATSGTTITLTQTGGPPSPSQYCATPTSVTMTSDGMMGLAPSATTNMLMGNTTMVLTKE